MKEVVLLTLISQKQPRLRKQLLSKQILNCRYECYEHLNIEKRMQGHRFEVRRDLDYFYFCLNRIK